MSSKAQIDINANREDISKFIRENKLNIRITDGKKKRSVKELRDDLEKGGYALKGVSSVKKGGRPATTLKGMRKVVEREKVKQKAEAQVGIKLMGFSSDTQPISTNVSSLEVEMSGRGGIPIQAPAPAPAPAPAKQRNLVDTEYQEVIIYEDEDTGEIFLNKEATIFLGRWDDDVENIDMTPQGRIEFEKLQFPEFQQTEEKEITKEEIDKLLEIVGDTSRYLPVRKEAWRQLRDAGINISEPTKKPVKLYTDSDEEEEEEDENDFRKEIEFEGVKYYLDEDDYTEWFYTGKPVPSWAPPHIPMYNIRGEEVGKWDPTEDDIIFLSDKFRELHEDQGYDVYEPAVAGDDDL